MQDFILKINEFDSLLSEKTGLKYELKLVGKHNSEVFFKSVYEGIDVLLKIDKSTFDTGAVKWKYCADPSQDYWVSRNSNDLISMTQDFYDILKKKMFDSDYLTSLKK